MSQFFRFAALVGVLSVTGCGGGEEEQVCDASAAVSVAITVVDQDGAQVPEAVVTWSVDGGEPQNADCMNDVCFAGYEVAGEFTITATYDWTSDDGCCWASDTATANVTVEQGECHVVGQSVTLTLDTTVACVDQGDTGDCLG